MPTLLKALMIDKPEEKEVIVDYITRDFPLLYERMIRYIADGKLAYSLLEGPFRTFGAKFVTDILGHIDYTSNEEPFVIGNLIKVQSKSQKELFNFDLVRTFFLYNNCGALRKNDYLEITKAIKNLDEGKTRRILADRFDRFKKLMLKRVTTGEVGAEYVAAQIEQQLKNFCKQLSLFEDIG